MDFSNEEIEAMLNDSDFDANRKQLKAELISTGFYAPAIADMIARSDIEELEDFGRRIKHGNNPIPDKNSKELEFRNWEAMEVVRIIEKIIGKEL